MPAMTQTFLGTVNANAFGKFSLVGFRVARVSHNKAMCCFQLNPQTHRDTIKEKGDLQVAFSTQNGSSCYSKNYFRNRQQGNVQYGGQVQYLSDVMI